ncbi:retropepsin-like aspartic protease [Pontimicrobium aquaticum]|uniref:Acid protease n=1 Tax=Pontimicrobium aquaticum TaxID=2565367 RepID=A0A4U0ES89_9FLAO|nr:retropepsin-like aspartic protease [Pontimicrobium aquaticum]TJY34607.1 acid protease [Pontimicrobium aquaticum]
MSLQEFLINKGYCKVKLHYTKTNHFELKAAINGEKGRFILDTGASNSCVDFEFTNMFGLTVEDSDVKAAGAGAIDMLTQVSKKNIVKIGKWKSKKNSIILFDLTHVNMALANHNANSVHGIIGADILKKTKAIIDYNKKYLYLKL